MRTAAAAGRVSPPDRRIGDQNKRTCRPLQTHRVRARSVRQQLERQKTAAGRTPAAGPAQNFLESGAACGERALLPAVRAAAGSTLVIADGYSCREQIVQSTGREVLHLDEVPERAIPTTSRSMR